jgi:hypothetical protein
MNLNVRDKIDLIALVVNGTSCRDAANDFGCSTSRAQQLTRTTVFGIWNLTKSKYLDETYSLALARADKEILLNNLEGYFNGSLVNESGPDISLDSMVCALSLPPRFINPFALQNIVTIRELLQLSKSSISNLKGIGRSGLAQIERELNKNGFALEK